MKSACDAFGDTICEDGDMTDVFPRRPRAAICRGTGRSSPHGAQPRSAEITRSSRGRRAAGTGS